MEIQANVHWYICNLKVIIFARLKNSVNKLPALRSSYPICVMGLTVGCYRVYPPSPLFI